MRFFLGACRQIEESSTLASDSVIPASGGIHCSTSDKSIYASGLSGFRFSSD
jgi:hypothetical protein